MASIVVSPPQLRQTSKELIERARRLAALLAEVESRIDKLDSRRFEGTQAEAVRNRFNSMRERIRAFPPLITSFASDLEKIAEVFEQEDSKLTLAQTGQVLGMSLTQSAGKTKWESQRDRYQELLQQQEELEARLEQVKSGLGITNLSPEAVQARIDELIIERDKLRQELNNWLNQIMPDLENPGLDFGDGPIWRTKADALEEQIAKIDIEIGNLSQVQSLQAELADLNNSVAAATPPEFTKLSSSVELNPPSPYDGKWSGYCAGYVKTVAPEIGGVASAKNWITTQGLSPFSSGDDLRTQLEPGDVVVWDAGQQGADSTDGHAAIIVEVHEDYVVLAESAWGKKYENADGSAFVGRELKRENIGGLYIWSNPKK